MENISYSSHICDEAERAQVHFHVKAADYTLLNSLYPYEFLLTPQGFDGIMPTTFETDPKLIDKILDSLSAMSCFMSMLHHD